MNRNQRNKWVLLAFLCGLFLVYIVDRAILGVLAIPIQDELKLTDVQFGLLSSGIFWTYALVVPFAGLVGDRLDRSRLIGWAAILWSLMTFCAGFADCFTTLFLLVSVAVVVPQTLYSPTANALISEHHADTRTLALSCHQAAYYTGWFVSGAAVAAVLSFCGSWRWTYFIFGGVGMVLGAAFLLYGSSGKASAAAAAAKPPVSASLKAFFGCPTALLCAFAYIVEESAGDNANVRMLQENAAKPAIKTVLSGWGGWQWLYQLRQCGSGGLITERAAYAPLLGTIWRLYESGERGSRLAQAYAMYRLLIDQRNFPGGLRGYSLYLLQKEGLCRSLVSRQYQHCEVTEGGTFGWGEGWKLKTVELTERQKAELDALYDDMMDFVGRDGTPCRLRRSRGDRPRFAMGERIEK